MLGLRAFDIVSASEAESDSDPEQDEEALSDSSPGSIIMSRFMA